MDGLEPMERLRREIARAPLHDFLRVEAEAVAADGAVSVRLPFRPEFRRARDVDDYHGGILAALIDLTAHAAVAVRSGGMAPTIDLRVDYLRGAPAVTLRATGRLLRLGRSIARADVEVWAGDERLVAVGRGTFQIPTGERTS
jgi:uncharacterized protein (TIGR00369 family)